jgi:hypothetical protein
MTMVIISMIIIVNVFIDHVLLYIVRTAPLNRSEFHWETCIESNKNMYHLTVHLELSFSSSLICSLWFIIDHRWRTIVLSMLDNLWFVSAVLESQLSSSTLFNSQFNQLRCKPSCNRLERNEKYFRKVRLESSLLNEHIETNVPIVCLDHLWFLRILILVSIRWLSMNVWPMGNTRSKSTLRSFHFYMISCVCIQI